MSAGYGLPHQASRLVVLNSPVENLSKRRGDRRVLRITIVDGRIAQVDIIADPERLRTLNLAVL